MITASIRSLTLSSHDHFHHVLQTSCNWSGCLVNGGSCPTFLPNESNSFKLECVNGKQTKLLWNKNTQPTMEQLKLMYLVAKKPFTDKTI